MNDPASDRGQDADRDAHYHYVCPECGHETCPSGKPTAGMFLTAAGTHAGEEHPEMWGPEPRLERRDGCAAA